MEKSKTHENIWKHVFASSMDSAQAWADSYKEFFFCFPEVRPMCIYILSHLASSQVEGLHLPHARKCEEIKVNHQRVLKLKNDLKVKISKACNSSSEARWLVKLLPPAPSPSPPTSSPPAPFSTLSPCFLVPKGLVTFLSLTLAHLTVYFPLIAFLIACRMPSFLPFSGLLPDIFSYEQGIHYK